MKWITLFSILLLGGCANQSNLQIKQSEPIKFDVVNQKSVYTFLPLVMNSSIKLPLKEPKFPKRNFLRGSEPTFSCGTFPHKYRQQPDIKYTLRYSGKLSGHSILSPYAEFTDGEYWQVIFHD